MDPICVCVYAQEEDTSPGTWQSMNGCLSAFFDPLQAQFVQPAIYVLAQSSYMVDKNNLAAIFAPQRAE